MDYICAGIDKFAAKNLINEQKDNFFNFKELLKSKSYIPFCDSLFDHILGCTNLSKLDKLLYLTTYSLSFINLNKTGHRYAALSAKKIAETISCSKSQVLFTQKSLNDKGYLTITREKNKFGQNNRNLLSPMLPKEVFSPLSLLPDKKGTYLPFNENQESHLSYLEKSKQYIPLNYLILKSVASNPKLTSRQKILWLVAYTKAYKNSLIVGNKSNGQLSFTCSYLELASELGCSSKVITADLNALAEQGFMQKQKFYVKSGSGIQDRCDKSLWHIIISLPAECRKEIEAIDNRKGYIKRVTKPHNSGVIGVNNIEIDKKSTPISDPDLPHFRPHINKDFKIYKDRSKQADFKKIEEEIKEQELNISNLIKQKIVKTNVELSEHNLDCQTKHDTKHKNESSRNQNLSSSTSTKTAKDKKSYSLQRKSLSEVEPISEEEATALRSSSGRDFSCNYMNKLVKKLFSLFPDHGFYTRKLFLSYMSKTLSQELRETTKANNTDFVFKADEQTKAREKYLEEVENSYDTSASAQLKKKIAGRFDSSLAYQVLSACDFQGITSEVEEGKEIVSGQNQTFTISLIKPLSLEEHQEEMLLEQVRALYGNKITKIEFKQPAYLNVGDNNIKEKATLNAICTKQKDEQALTDEALLEAIPGTIWHKVSKNLIIKHGIHLYKAWLGKNKMEAIIDEQNKTLSLKASLGFIASYVQSNYLSEISAVCRSENYNLDKLWA